MLGSGFPLQVCKVGWKRSCNLEADLGLSQSRVRCRKLGHLLLLAAVMCCERSRRREAKKARAVWLSRYSITASRHYRSVGRSLSSLSRPSKAIILIGSRETWPSGRSLSVSLVSGLSLPCPALPCPALLCPCPCPALPCQPATEPVWV